MKTNMGKNDKLIRVILGVIFAALYLTGIVSGTWGIVLLIIGVALITTSMTGFCPLYTLMDIDTCATE